MVKKLSTFKDVALDRQIAELVDGVNLALGFTSSGGVIVKSSTTGSTKRFRITVIDDGTIDAVEVT